MARFGKTDEGLKSTPKKGLEQMYSPTAWINNAPIVRNRDIIQRFDEDGNYEFRYEVQKVTRNKRFYGKPSRQVMTLKRLDKTEPVYRFPLVHRGGTGVDNHPIHNDDQIQNFILKTGGNFPHIHAVQVAGPILNVTEITGYTTEVLGSSVHRHLVVNGVVQSADLDNHTHDIRL
jgi:hypothetical protein